MDKLLKATHLDRNFNFKKLQWPFDLIRGTFELKVHVLGSDNNFRRGSQNVWVIAIGNTSFHSSRSNHFWTIFFFLAGGGWNEIMSISYVSFKKYAFHPRFFPRFVFGILLHVRLKTSSLTALLSPFRNEALTFDLFFNRRKYRSQNTNVFAELDAETVTSVDCDGMIFDPTTFKAVREVSCWFKVTWHHLNTLYTHTFETNGARAGYKRETERAWESERESCFCWHLLWFLYWAKD